jgi:hypothetical protein
MGKLLKSTILGGSIVFLWGAFSWTILPWHGRVLHGFEHDVDVVRMLDFGAPQSGMYVYPPTAPMELNAGLSMAFVSYSKGGMRPGSYAWALCLQFLGAFILSWFLSKTSGLSYRQKVLSASVFGLAVGILGSGPYWIWWHFATDYTLVSISDAIISWTLAGLAIGRVL